MAWTAPMTAVANSAFTAAQFNTYVRDNLNMTAPALATTAGRLFVATGANAIAERAISQSTVATSESTASTSATDLATVGPAVTVTTGTQALVFWSAQINNNTTAAMALMDYAVTGASSRSAADLSSLRHSGTATHLCKASQVHYLTGLTAGSNTFTAKYWVGSGTGTFANRILGVIAL